MKKQITFFKTLLVAAALLVGTDAWAAGYTRTLSNELHVTGYKAKAFYDFQKNDPEVLPTTGDLRYRDGGIWGLHNFGSGTRSATATIPVAKEDILVLQHYASNVTATIDRGTLNNALTSTYKYEIYDITADADDITFTIARYGGIVAALVMEKDGAVETANYTINYKLDEEIIKTVSGTGVAVGTIIPIEESFFKDDVKYVKNDDQPSSLTVAAGGSVLNVAVSIADTWTYTLKAVDGETNDLKTIASGSTYVGETQRVYYPKAIYANSKWYETTDNASYFYKTIAEGEPTISVTYTESSRIDYFFETADMTVVSQRDGGYVPERASNGDAVRVLADGYYYTPSINAGVYTVIVNKNNSNSGLATMNLDLRDSKDDITSTGLEISQTNSSNYIESSVANLIVSEDGLKLQFTNPSSDYSSNFGFDYVILQKVGDDAVTFTLGAEEGVSYKSYVTTAATDFDASGVEAYVATASTDTKVILTKIEKAPAGTPVILKGTKGQTTAIMFTADEVAAPAENLLKASTGTAISASESKYVLAFNDPNWEFCHFEGTLSAGKVYLDVPAASAKSLEIVFDGQTTGINDASHLNAETTKENIVFNLNGQRIAAPQKGINIINGRKVIVK